MSLPLLGVTGSGKTFTLANVVENVNRPTLVIAPNKLLAAQLYGEFRDLFPDAAVHYFVSYCASFSRVFERRAKALLNNSGTLGRTPRRSSA